MGSLYRKDVCSIINNNERKEWVKLLTPFYIESNNSTTTVNDVPSLQFTFNEIDNMHIFPFNVGDIITLKAQGGRFIIYDYPWLDDRKKYYTTVYKEDGKNPNYGEAICEYGNTYWISGIINNKLGGTEELPYFLTADMCHYSNMEKIGNIKELSSNDELWNTYQGLLRNDYFKHYLKGILDA